MCIYISICVLICMKIPHPVIAAAITEPLVEVGDWLGQIKTEGQP